MVNYGSAPPFMPILCYDSSIVRYNNNNHVPLLYRVIRMLLLFHLCSSVRFACLRSSARNTTILTAVAKATDTYYSKPVLVPHPRCLECLQGHVDQMSCFCHIACELARFISIKHPCEDHMSESQ